MKKSHFNILTYIVWPAFCVAALWLYFLFSPAVTTEGGAIYYLKPGTSKSVAIEELTQQGVIRHPMIFSLYAYLHPTAHLKTGEYRFPVGSSPASIWRQITNGTGFLQRPFTIVPGSSFIQIRKALAQAEGLKQSSASLDDKQIMTLLGAPEIMPEGEFFPETYYYTKGSPDIAILKRAYDLMQIRLNESWQNRAAGLPYKNIYEALIAASLIEKEAYLDSERPMISGVLVNRLRKNMLLQIDATVIYGIGDRYDGKIYKKDLRTDTAYNTYKRIGLPPTPIAMPGSVSIEAVMHPQQNDYYYYVAKGDGAHQFSRNLSDHNSAVKATAKQRLVTANTINTKKNMHQVLQKAASLAAEKLRSTTKVTRSALKAN